MSVRYLTPARLGKILFTVGSLCAGLISALLSLAGSRHNYTLPLAFETMTELLDHSNVSSTPRDTIICYFCSLSNSTLRGSWSTYTTLLGDAWYCQLPSFTCKVIMPSNTQFLRKTPRNSLCIFVSIPGLLYCLLLCSCWA